ncbi:hypothetical protein NPIL_513361 [Nephila pilipes]|uniref:Uncharacterized protein n=1 Tax=Nephila pilipes TaxID=299642 RepID=A0A8X6QTB1_NEPPI|nr:hypothetical protein NPIL_513361 [Nephila pilipes]
MTTGEMRLFSLDVDANFGFLQKPLENLKCWLQKMEFRQTAYKATVIMISNDFCIVINGSLLNKFKFQKFCQLYGQQPAKDAINVMLQQEAW